MFPVCEVIKIVLLSFRIITDRDSIIWKKINDIVKIRLIIIAAINTGLENFIILIIFNKS